MELWIIIIVGVWFALGAVVAAFIYHDMKIRKRISSKWIVIGFLLNVIGLLTYYIGVKISRRHPYQYPPRPQYDTPLYRFEEGQQEEPVPVAPPEENGGKREFDFSEGIPRCPRCGAAISAHEWDCPRCGTNIRY